MPEPFQTPASKPAAPHLVRFLVKNATIGFAMAIVFVGAILIFNVGNLTSLFIQSGIGLFAIALMTLMIGLTFASVQMGLAVMFGFDSIDKDQTKGGDPLMSPEEMRRLGLRPVPVKTPRRFD